MVSSLQKIQTKTVIAPSILAADFSCLGKEVESLTREGADWVHCDIMDGCFVENISFGSAVVDAVARHTSLPLDIHLMVEHPDRYLERFLPHGAVITSHLEASHDVSETLGRIRAAGKKAGLSIKPDTSLKGLESFWGQIDVLLIMTVYPGFGGQSFIEEMLPKITEAADQRTALGLDFLIEVDGGITIETAARCRDAGAEVMVAGTSIFRAADRGAEIAALRA